MGGVPSLPLYPTDDGWPYPDALAVEPAADDDIDLDLLELRVDPHAYADLTELEYFAVSWRYGLTGEPHSMKNLALGARLQPRRGPRGARRRARQAAAALDHAVIGSA